MEFDVFKTNITDHSATYVQLIVDKTIHPLSNFKVLKFSYHNIISDLVHFLIFLALVKNGAFLFVDDTNWVSVRPKDAILTLREKGLIYQLRWRQKMSFLVMKTAFLFLGLLRGKFRNG